VLHPERSTTATKQGYQHEHHQRHRERAAHDRCGLRQLLRRHNLRPDGPHDRPRGEEAPQRPRGAERLRLHPAHQPRAGAARLWLRRRHRPPPRDDRLADAALAAAERSVSAAEPAAAALMPVWAFEPDGGSEDVLLSSVTLWNVNLLIDALRVDDDDHPVPVPAVRERFQRWVAAAGSGPTLATSRLPGRDGSYVIFAAAAPA
jgi:hypothetical protein